MEFYTHSTQQGPRLLRYKLVVIWRFSLMAILFNSFPRCRECRAACYIMRHHKRLKIVERECVVQQGGLYKGKGGKPFFMYFVLW